MFIINSNIPIAELQQYLSDQGWLNPENEKLLSLEKPGEGNMNVLVRVISNERTFILKQSRPYVQKYPQIAAPLHRIHIEHEFYQSIKGNVINSHVPKILGYNASDHILMLEDLGHCEDMTVLYQKRIIENFQLDKLVTLLGLIHKNKAPINFPENMEMRRLNHEHIFVLPFMEDNGFQLDNVQNGLQELSLRYKEDTDIKEVIESIGKMYLFQGETILHGDFYPGSWMTKNDAIYIIDPEFSFVGFAEFDLGVMAAHIIMATMDTNYLNKIHQKYKGKADSKLMCKVAGIEIMRRLIGLAQLPLERSIQEKEYLLQMAHEMILV